MFTLQVKKDLTMSEYVEGDPRLFVVGHAANALSIKEVSDLVQVLGNEFGDYFEAGNEATQDLLEKLSNG